MGLTEDNISMKGIGYKEMIGYIHGEYDFEEAVRLIKRNTRHYAKRQMTWFRRYEDLKWFDLSQYETEDKAVSDMLGYIRGE
ncbi:MAG: tRNA (adenosine(37)-N6)-dimethylallyltransferase MiaA, partial [Bacillota bacterium]|nr:tRNA (adenosine(37)-N6)-dimethylallyltransferase MiaA [Bacillota bacterium]